MISAHPHENRCPLFRICARLGCPAKISCSCSPWMEVTSARPPARPSRCRCGHPLSKLLKLRAHFEELENPSAQNSRTVKNLTAATHGLLQYASTPIHKHEKLAMN